MMFGIESLIIFFLNVFSTPKSGTMRVERCAVLYHYVRINLGNIPAQIMHFAWKSLAKQGNFHSLAIVLHLDFLPTDLARLIVSYLFFYAQENFKQSEHLKLGRLPLSRSPRHVTMTQMGSLLFAVHHGNKTARKSRHRVDFLLHHPDAPSCWSHFYSLDRYQIWCSSCIASRHLNPEILNPHRTQPPPFPWDIISQEDFQQHLAIFIQLAIQLGWVRDSDYKPTFFKTFF